MRKLYSAGQPRGQAGKRQEVMDEKIKVANHRIDNLERKSENYEKN